MTDFWKEIILGFLLTVPPILTYKLGLRKQSGKISTSEAQDLWKENRELKEAYRQQTDAQVKVAEHLRNDLNVLRLDNITIKEESLKIRMRLGWYRILRKEYVSEIELLQEEILIVKRHIEDGVLENKEDRLEAAQRVYNRLEALKKRILATDAFEVIGEIEPVKKTISSEVPIVKT